MKPSVPISRPDPGDDEKAAAARVLGSGWIMQGPEVAAFEGELAAYVGARHAVACANGTVALELALRALGVGAGDEVVTVSHSFIASASCVVNARAVPVFVERLRDHGEQVAVIAAGEQLTYRQLADRVHMTAELIGSERRLVLVETGNDVAALVGYLAALHGGHVALLADRHEHDRIGALVERFNPDVVIALVDQLRGASAMNSPELTRSPATPAARDRAGRGRRARRRRPPERARIDG